MSASASQHLLRRLGTVAAALTVLAMLSASPGNASNGYRHVSTTDAAGVVAAVDWTPVPGGHFCQSTGWANGQQGVACNNFYQGYDDQGFRVVRSEMELKCGDSSQLLPCISALAIGNLDGGPVYTARCVRDCPRAGYKIGSPDVVHVYIGCKDVSATVNAQRNRGGFTLPNGIQKFMYGALTSKVEVCT